MTTLVQNTNLEGVFITRETPEPAPPAPTPCSCSSRTDPNIYPGNLTSWTINGDTEDFSTNCDIWVEVQTTGD